MKIVMSALFLILLLSVAVFAQQDQSKQETDRKVVKGFGGFLLVVKDPQAFIEEWQKPETPNITPVKNIDRGVLIGAFVLFGGCKTDEQRRCNTEVDYTLYKPDGSVYAERKNQPLWKDEAPPAANTQLSKAILGIRFEKEDPSGVYKVKAKVSDLNAQITFELETVVRLN